METNAIEVLKIKEGILKYYSEAHITGEASLYKEILHPEWRFFLLEAGKLRLIDRPEYISFYDPSKVDPKLHWETEFFYIDIYDHLASVKLRLENEKVKYIDYFNMMKVENKWWIVHKMSYPIEKNPIKDASCVTAHSRLDGFEACHLTQRAVDGAYAPRL